MHFRGLDLNLLVVLDTLITERSISRTGEKIHLSQPATSGALARLREYFKDDLLVPLGRKMILTPLAEELAHPVRQVLLQTEAIIHRNPAFSPATSDRAFRLVMSDYVAATLMSRALPEIERQAPRIKVHVLVPGARTDWIERGEADLMIMPHQYLSANHPSEPLFEDDFVCIAWAGNTSLRKRSISLPDYLRLGHVVVRFGEQQEVPAFEEKFMEHFSEARRIEVVTTGFTLVPPLIIGTTRIATLHRRLAEFSAKHLPLKIFKPPVEIPPMVESMQWHTVRGADPGLRWMRVVLKACCAQDS
ncbi:MAG TPA: LysR family transcriptional regulator [Bryobacteraceae bacterium]|jgi:DNA-binding transcriptional LysR family regulator